MSLRGRILRNLTAGAFGRLVSALGPLALLPTFLTVWGKDAYGEWLLVTSIPACIMLAPDLGITAVVVNRMSTLTGEGKLHQAQDLFRTAFWILLLCCAIFAIAGSVGSAFVPWNRVLKLHSISPYTAVAIIAILCFQVIFQQLSYCVVGLYRCALCNSRVAFLASIFGLLELLVTIGALTLGALPLTIAFVGLFWKSLALGVYLVDASRLPNTPRLGFAGFRLDLIKPLFLPALGQGGMLLLQGIQNQGIITIIGIGLDSSAVTSFQSLRTMTNGFKSLFGLLAGAVLAELPHTLGQGQTVAVGRLLRQIGQLALLAGVAAILGTWVFGAFVYGHWTSGKVEYNTLLSMTLAFAVVPFLLSTPSSIYLHSSNGLHWTVPVTLPCLLISLVLMVGLMPLCGVVAAGYSTLIWESLQFVVLTWYFRKLAPDIWAYFTRKQYEANGLKDKFRNLVGSKTNSTASKSTTVIDPTVDQIT